MKLKKLTFTEMKANGTKLSFSELMKLRGGNGYGYGHSGTCAVKIESDVHCDLSKGIVDNQMVACHQNGWPCRWCCDSCPTTDWWIAACGRV